MNHFQRRGGTLYAEDLSLAEIASCHGTPTYVYSTATISRHVRVLQQGLGGLPHHICYAVKANGNLALLQLLGRLGCGFDAVSVGELARVFKAGGSLSQTIFSGVGKRDDEIESALRAGVLYICVESANELEAVALIAERLGQRAPVSVRVNPDVDAKTHPYIATGLKENKFGVPAADTPALYHRYLDDPRVALVGVTCHIGSQITELDPFLQAAKRMLAIAQSLKAMGVPLAFLGVGGGLGVPYYEETPPSPQSYGEALAAVLGSLDLTVVFEPGRVIVGNAGILLTRVIRSKPGAKRPFILVDAGMNDLLRPALYEARHTIEPVAAPGGDGGACDVVGPVCESADTFAIDCALPAVGAGDLLAIRGAGAYCFAMASNYNGRPRPAEVLVDGRQTLLIRKREALTDLWRGEALLDGSTADLTLESLLLPGSKSPHEEEQS